MLLLLAYVAASMVLWFLASALAPVGSQISFSRALFATVSMVVCDCLSHVYLSTIIHGWWFLVSFICCVISAMVFLRLPLLRSLVAVSAFVIVVLGTIFVVGFAMEYHRMHRDGQTPMWSNKSLQATATALVSESVL